jgi:ribonuclease HI
MIESYFDGCMEPRNPGGVGAYGVIIFKDGREIFRESKMFEPRPDWSNNYCEYSGFKAILDYLIEHDLTKSQIIVRGDSRLVLCQMFITCGYRKKWKMNGGFYLPIALKCKELLKQFPNIAGEWIPREKNFLADELSKKELINAGIEFRIQKVER